MTSAGAVSRELPVPEAARKAYDEVTINLLLVAKGIRQPNSGPNENIPKIAAPVVAAELSRLALVYDTLADGRSSDPTEIAAQSAYAAVAAKLRERIDELDAS